MTFIAGTHSLPFYAERGRHDMSNISSFLLPPRTHKRTITHVWGRPEQALIWSQWHCLVSGPNGRIVCCCTTCETNLCWRRDLSPSFLPPCWLASIHLGKDKRVAAAAATTFAGCSTTCHRQRPEGGRGGQQGQRWRGRAGWLAGGRASQERE